jgi:hypothetical protein
MSLEQLTSQINTLTTRIESLNFELNKNIKSIGNYEKKINALQIKNNFIESEKLELVKQINDINTQITKLNSQSKKYNSIDDLIDNIGNTYQNDILCRLKENSDYSKIYLSSYEPNTDTKKKDVIGTINVFGTFNPKKQLREQYNIKIYNKADKGTFYCSCADHKFNSAKHNSVCKHICFVVCKLLKFFDIKYFETKKLDNDKITELINKLTTTNIWNDEDLTKKLKTISLDTFRNFTKEIDDCCPICFNDIDDSMKDSLLSCPTCHNYVHTECMEVWLEQKQSCMLCKSSFWEKYKNVKEGKVIVLY